MTDKQPYLVPDEPGRWRAIMLAIIVHTALIALLWVGVRWQNVTPVALEAELWSPEVREAAPRPEPKPESEPVVKPVAKPEPVRKADPRPVPAVKLPPPPKPVETPVVKPDIALEQEKKRQIQARKERLEDEREERLKADKLRAEQERKDKAKVDEKRQAKRDAEDAARDKAEAADVARKKADAVADAAKSKAAAADAAKKKADAADLAKKKADAADAAKKTAADKQRKQDLADELDGEKRRADEMRRVTGGVTGSGGAGTAPKSQGGRADSGYVNRVGAKIKSNTIFNTPESLDNNPSVEYEVSLLPDGSIRGIRKLKSSNVSGFDDAVQRAITKSAPFPPDQTGIAPTSFTLIHRPKDQ